MRNTASSQFSSFDKANATELLQRIKIGAQPDEHRSAEVPVEP